MKVQYKQMFGRDLVDDLKSETSGNFEDAIVALFYPPIDLDVETLYKAMKGLGTDEDTLIEIIGTRPNHILKEIVKRYEELHNEPLEKRLSSELSGDLKKIMISLIQCNRSENKNVNEQEMQKKAEELYSAGEGKLGTDESVFNKIFATASPEELLSISKHYYKLTGKKSTILDAIEKEFSGDMKKIYKTIVYALISPPEYYARRIYDAVKGWGTKDTQLIRICVCRDEIDLQLIKKYYKTLYNEDLIERIKSETSGSYRKLLVEVVDH